MATFSTSSDIDLIIVYQETKDSLAFGELYRRYNQKIYLYGVQLLKDRDLALDMTQDLFLKVAAKLSDLQEPLTFVKWLFRIAHNDCINILKKNTHRVYSGLELANNISDEDADIAIAQEARFLKLEAVMHDISEEDKTLLIAKYYDKKSIIELEAEYGLSKSAIKMRLNRSRNRLKKAMAV